MNCIIAMIRDRAIRELVGEELISARKHGVPTNEVHTVDHR